MFHVSCAKLADDRTIMEIDEAMYGHLRMDQHLDRFGGKIEKPGRLDHFQPLVHHGRAVDRDLLPHAPVRVLHSFLRGDQAKLSRSRILNGPPDAVEQMRSTASFADADVVSV